MNTQDVFVKVSSFVESQINLVNSAMHELDKDQCANCNVHTGLIVDRQDSSCSKIIAPPSLSVSIAPPSLLVTIASSAVSKTIAPPSTQHL